jgi:hypothetical protein
MKRLLIMIAILGAPCCLMAQDFVQLGKSKEEVRGLNKTFFYITKSETDTCDSFCIRGAIQMIFYYKGNICNREKYIFPFGYMQLFEMFLNEGGKKISGDTWIIGNGALRVVLEGNEAKNECVLNTTLNESKN